MIEWVLHGVYQSIEILMNIQPEVDKDSADGKLLSALSKAVSDYEDYLYPELNLNKGKE